MDNEGVIAGPQAVPIPVLIAGAGTMARVHAEALSEIPEVELAGIVNERLASAKRLAIDFGTRAFTTLKQAIRATRARALFVCLPTPLHRAFVAEAARAGLHVFCEKPIGRSVRDAQAMIEICARANALFMVGHVLRCFPQYAKLHELVAGGEVGKPAMARLSRGGAAPKGARDWYARHGLSGGVLVDLLIHDFDWLRWTLGPVVRVHARHTGLRKGRPAVYVLAVLRHESGAISHVEGYWGHELPFRTQVEIAGDRGALHYDSLHPVAVELHRGEDRPERAPILLPESPVKPSPYFVEDQHFIDCLRGRAEPFLLPGDALEALRISVACLASVRTGEPTCP
jgi:predicted dehydrogenase